MVFSSQVLFFPGSLVTAHQEEFNKSILTQKQQGVSSDKVIDNHNRDVIKKNLFFLPVSRYFLFEPFLFQFGAVPGTSKDTFYSISVIEVNQMALDDHQYQSNGEPLNVVEPGDADAGCSIDYDEVSRMKLFILLDKLVNIFFPLEIARKQKSNAPSLL